MKNTTQIIPSIIKIVLLVASIYFPVRSWSYQYEYFLQNFSYDFDYSFVSFVMDVASFISLVALLVSLLAIILSVLNIAVKSAKASLPFFIASIAFSLIASVLIICTAISMYLPSAYPFIAILIVLISIVEIIIYRKTKPVQKFYSTKEYSPKEQSPTLNKLLEYKELLDMGIISQEEFEEKKKILLNK